MKGCIGLRSKEARGGLCSAGLASDGALYVLCILRGLARCSYMVGLLEGLKHAVHVLYL